MKNTSLKIEGADGLALFGQCWEPNANVMGTVGIVHGLGEHSGRYAHLATKFAERGYRVVAYDLRGHGKTAGRRGHAPDFSLLVEDVSCLVSLLMQQDESGRVILYGHSLGGNLVLNYAIRCDPSLAGVVASSPLLLPTAPPPAWKLGVANMLQRIWPAFPFSTGIDRAGLSHDPQVAKDFATDPLTHDRVSARLGAQMLEAGRWAFDHASKLAGPALLMHGTADPITSARATCEFAERVAGKCKLKTWPELYHELHWELDRNEVIQFALDWIDQA